MGRLFGTDGVRGLANGDLTPQTALGLAQAAAGVFAEHDREGRRAHVRRFAVVGRDGRASGEMLEAAVVAGLASAGVDVLRAGVLPTPAIAYLTSDLDADLGVVLSASHNPMPDNGVKFFARGGAKLADELEDEIEARLFEEWDRPTGALVGRVRELPDAADRYVAHVVDTAPASLAGLRIVVDCAHGAASAVAPAAYRKAGADVVALSAEPDGVNINDDCGSTHPEALQDAVVRHRADAGIAHDGDADRCLAVDSSGRLVDGDVLLAICAVAMQEAGELAGPAVATTVMTNLGFRQAMAGRGIDVVETPVGDRYVLAAMLAGGLSLGGEQSGHLIFSRHATTGDGLITGLQVLGRMAATGRPLADLATVMSRLPQVLVNVAVPDRAGVAGHPVVKAAVEEARSALGDSGRVLLRPSGTEPLVRVMVEAGTEEEARRWADGVAAAVTAAGGG